MIPSPPNLSVPFSRGEHNIKEEFIIKLHLFFFFLIVKQKLWELINFPLSLQYTVYPGGTDRLSGIVTAGYITSMKPPKEFNLYLKKLNRGHL